MSSIMPGDYNCLVEVYEELGGIVKESGGKPGPSRFCLEANIYLITEPMFDPLRSDPSFAALLKKIGLDK